MSFAPRVLQSKSETRSSSDVFIAVSQTSRRKMEYFSEKAACKGNTLEALKVEKERTRGQLDCGQVDKIWKTTNVHCSNFVPRFYSIT